jgi:glycosyltransferase involved in cell wall biosynthesis
MNILIAITYYRPYFSGLTIYAERLAIALAGRGHQVTVLTSRYDKKLPQRENLSGVNVIRANVLFRVSKGVIMPSIPIWAWRLAKQADIVNLHAPQLDAAVISAAAQLLKKPVVMTYHCDLLLPGGLINTAANRVSNIANAVSARLSDVIVANTRDYAESSPFLKKYLGKLRPVYPPASIPPASVSDIRAFQRKANILTGQVIIGMSGRLASEKGAEYLIQAMPLILEKYPSARVLFVGQHENVLGEEHYARKLAPLIQDLGEHWSFMGYLSEVELAAFYKVADVLVLPSLNETESFGMVQVEAMLCGTPVVASDLPGVRVPVMITGMGEIVPAADYTALAAAVIKILDNPEVYKKGSERIPKIFSSRSIAEEYETIFNQLIKTIV